MALLYFYDSTDLDRSQLSSALSTTDHRWEFVEDKISLDNLDPETEVISVFVSSTVTREMIEALPKLRLIACRSTGFNNIDFDSVRERGIVVVNVPTYGESTVAEYAFTLISALLRQLPAVLHAENEAFKLPDLVGTDLNGKTIGVIGSGRIGQKAIKIANGYEMNVLAYDAFPRDELQEQLNFRYVSLEELLENSDIITIHTPYLPSTHHLINAERLSKIKPTAVLINTARGEIVDTAALVTALSEKRLAGAALDVIEGEVLLSVPEEQALLRHEDIAADLLRHSVEISLLQKMPNVILSPHNAFNTVEAIGRINTTTVDNIVNFWNNDTPNKVVPPEKPAGKLVIIRHAESEWNATGQWSGISDVHLDDKGFHEASMLGLKLKGLGFHADVAYCSEQIRTRETIEGILNASQQFDVPIHTQPAINERDYGDFTGKNKWEVEKNIGQEAFDAIRRGWDVTVPNGETLKMVYERVVPFYQDTVVPQLQSGKNILIVAHGNSIRALMKYIDSIADEKIGELEMLFGSIVIYTVDDAGHGSQKEIHVIDSPPPNA